MKNWSKRFQSFWLHSSVFALDKQPKKLDFQSFFTSQRPFGGYFQWKACTTFQNICSLTKYSNAKLIKNILNFPVAFHGICFRKTTLKSIFHSFFISNRIIGGYFQGNMCIHICRWTRHDHSKFIRKVLLFFVALLRFCFWKTTWKAKFSKFFYLQESLWWLLSKKRVQLLPENM